MSSSTSTISSGWPRFAVVKSDFKKTYLRHITKEESTAKGVPPTSLLSDGNDITSPNVKFELISAKKNPKWVHIRCSHNNKFLTMQVDKNNVDNPWVILASSGEPIEKDSPEQPGTWFQVTKDGDTSFKFTHVASQRCAAFYRESLYAVLGIPVDGDAKMTKFDILDWQSLVLFPKTPTVAFLGPNNKYLTPYGDDSVMLFNSVDITDVGVAHQIFVVGDGYICVKNVSTGTFWTLSYKNWIYAIVHDLKDATLFWPVKVADNTVALLYKDPVSTKDRYTQIFSDDNYEDGLNANSTKITSVAKLVVVETAGSRSIYGIDFRPDEGRIYNVQALEKAHASAENYDEKDDNTLNLTFSYKTSRATTYSASGSFKIGVHTSIEVSEVPLVAKETIGFSYEFTTTIGWASTKTVETATESTYTVKVPSKTRTTVTLIATQGMCDVPFSYTQRDVLHDGSVIIHKLNDGIFTGLNTFNMDFIALEEKLPTNKDDNNPSSSVKNCITKY
ncbi:uncharacterized protein LOC115719067 [Cannabis sativa]|uniref:uncharacterized protein LOC115719067 n=1 Tax=Cannabis sativa TaxID=3483 RepID=UPI0029CA97BD|nr:uncharacterized protein LOC115719067 [Cannabis sativa]